jgi:glucokinase
VEVGGSGCQTVVFGSGTVEVLDGARRPAGAELAIAVPGLIDGGRVVAASNLDWYDVDPAEALELEGSAALVLNDAAAAALGEAALRATPDGLPDLVFLGIGTGVGGAVVVDGALAGDNLIGHAPGFSSLPCRCGRTGCLETIVSGWALPEQPDARQLEAAAAALGAAIEAEPLATPQLVVVAGGLPAAHPSLLELLATALPHRTVEPSAAPAAAKSASAWGLRLALAAPA